MVVIAPVDSDDLLETDDMAPRLVLACTDEFGCPERAAWATSFARCTPTIWSITCSAEMTAVHHIRFMTHTRCADDIFAASRQRYQKLLAMLVKRE